MNQHATATAQALVALRDSTDYSNWTDNTGGWELLTPIMSPEGVEFDSNGQVTDIELMDCGLSGDPPPPRCINTQLFFLDYHEMPGQLPRALGSLVSLLTLVLRGNDIGGM
jgi:hypothetical protein